ANLGYLYENAVAQMIVSSGRDLYYHTWPKLNSTHYYEVDFILQNGTKVSPVEVKSSSRKTHESIDAFVSRYVSRTGEAFLFSQKDVSSDGKLKLKPVYMLPFVLEEMW
ncbi:MAG: DUF4143 domain-containing protein, partial [Clostridia bacterium]|nr:DUF4143 domain-containing protein [Clostridia bacterium]